MVVANTPSGHPDVPETANVIYETVEGGRREEDRITSWAKTNVETIEFPPEAFCVEDLDRVMEEMAAW